MAIVNRNLNKYTEFFINELHSAIKQSIFVNPSYINDKDVMVINDVIGRYYSKIFWAFNRGNKELLHYPERAFDFNSTLIMLFMEAIRLVYVIVPSYTTVEKEIYIEALIRFIDTKISSLESNDLKNVELVNNLKSEIFNEYERILKQHNENVSDLKQNIMQQTQEYCKRKLDETNSFLYSYISDTDLIYCKNFSKILIINAIIGIALPFIINITNLDKTFAYVFYTVYMCLLIFIALVFPIFVSNIKEQFEKIKHLNRPYDYYSRLGVDVIIIYVSDSQLEYADPEMKNILLPLIADTRLELTDKYGFVMPGVRVLDNSNIENGYVISVRGNNICNLELDISKNVILKNNIEKYNIELPENSKEYGVNGEIYYQVEQDFCKSLNEDIYMSGVEFFKKVFSDIILKYIDELFTIEETVALFELYKSYLSSENLSSEQIQQLNDKFDVYDLREIFVKILKKNASLKDLVFVFNKIIKYSKSSTDVDYIAFQVYNDMKNNIEN